MKRSNRTCLVLAAVLTGFIALSCGNYAIFHSISLEDNLTTPIIAGSPRNIVVTGSRMYTWRLNGREVWFFGHAGGGQWRWDTLSSPGGIVQGLAAVGENVFAAVDYGGTSQIRRYTPGVGWSYISSHHEYQIGRLFCAGDIFFARALVRATMQYAILAFNDSGEMQEVRRGDYRNNIRGAAVLNGYIFVATERDGIFRQSPSPSIGSINLQAITPPSDFTVTGMIATGNQIVVVGSSNVPTLYVLRDASAFTTTPLILWGDGDHYWSWHAPSGQSFTGGLGFWYAFDSDANQWQRRLLLAGIEISNLVNGYREISLDDDGNIPGALAPRVPGNRDEVAGNSSLQSRVIYNSNIGQRSVQFIQQAPNLNDPVGGNFFPDNPNGWEPPIFASTSRAGLWVYYFRDDRWRADNNTTIWR